MNSIPLSYVMVDGVPKWNIKVLRASTAVIAERVGSKMLENASKTVKNFVCKIWKTST